jgi:glycosyltransferase involved in cell wall biosynthesis
MGAPRVALVHDWMVSPGGAERTLYQLHRMWPDAPIFTAAYAPEKFPEFADADVRTTWLDHISLAKTKHQIFPLARAWAFKYLDLSAYDIVISSSSAEAKYVRTGRNTLHVCYCHTPIRYYWSDYDWYVAHPPFGRLNGLAKGILPVMIKSLRRMDYKAAQKVDVYVANSKHVQARILKYYRRESTVIYPPVALERFGLSDSHGDYYLIVGRQVAYKRLDLAVEAFNKLGLPLRVSGVGEEIARLRPHAKSNIQFLGRVPDAELIALYGGAKAFIFPAEEDFGIVPVEAMATGTPVIAYGKGGLLESVVDGKTGLFFQQQTADALAEAVTRFESMTFDPRDIRKQAEKFGEAVFSTKMRAFVDEEWRQFPRKRSEAA